MNQLTHESAPATPQGPIFAVWGSDANYNRLRVKELRKLSAAKDVLYVASECALVVRLLKSAFSKSATIDDRRLAWEIIKSLRAERRQDSLDNRGLSNSSELQAAIKALAPNVNVNISMDQTKTLEHRAQHGLTAKSRERAAQRLAAIRAADDGDVIVLSEPIQAPAKDRG